MAELAMLADIQQTLYPKEVTHQLHVMAQARESSPVIDRRSNRCATPPEQSCICLGSWVLNPCIKWLSG